MSWLVRTGFAAYGVGALVVAVIYVAGALVHASEEPDPHTGWYASIAFAAFVVGVSALRTASAARWKVARWTGWSTIGFLALLGIAAFATAR